MPTAKKCKKSCMGFFDELAQKVIKGKKAQKSNYSRKAQAPTAKSKTETTSEPSKIT